MVVVPKWLAGKSCKKGRTFAIAAAVIGFASANANAQELPLPAGGANWRLSQATAALDATKKWAILSDTSNKAFGVADYTLPVKAASAMTIRLEVAAVRGQSKAMLVRVYFESIGEANCTLDLQSGKTHQWGVQQPGASAKAAGEHTVFECAMAFPKAIGTAPTLRIYPASGPSATETQPETTGQVAIGKITVITR